MAKKIIRPLKGIDVDSSTNRRDDNSIYMAKNLRINNPEASSMGEYSNIKGINLSIDGDDGYDILKITKISDNILIFIKGGSSDYIAVVKESYIPKNGEATVTLNLSKSYWTGTENTYHKVISGDFGFEIDNEINVKTYYESDNIQKIYWSTSNEPLRALNFIYSSNNDPSSFSNKDLEIIPSGDLNRVSILNTTSGSLLTGKIFYTYKGVNSIGTETQLAPLSDSYHITSSSERDTNDYDYKGYGFDVDSGKGISLKITDLPSIFSSVKIYSIHYIDDVSSPKISLIYDGSISESIQIIDSGTPLLELTAEEFALENQSYIKDVNLEIKNNRLFMANYIEDTFDIDDFASGDFWDARSFRFNGTEAVLFDSNLTSSIIVGGSGISINEVPEDHDCVNISNDLGNWNLDITKNNIYKDDGITHGSSGPNISITQSESGYLVPDSSGEDIKWYAERAGFYDTYDSSASPFYAGSRRTFKLNEVYRISIQFKENKGRISYPKWICDYKFTSDNYKIIEQSGNNIELSIFSLIIDVANIPNDPETNLPFEYRILYVPIGEQNQSVYWGLFRQIPKLDGTSEYKTVGVNYDSELLDTDIGVESQETVVKDFKYLEFISPDYCFGNKTAYQYVSFQKGCNNVNMIGGNKSEYQANVYKIYNFSWEHIGYNIMLDVNSMKNVEYSVDIEGSVSLSGSDTFLRRGSTVVNLKNDAEYHVYTTTVSSKIFGNSNKGRCQIIEPDFSISNILAESFRDSSIFGAAYVDNFQSKYGGLSYNARKGNGYIPLTGFTGESSINVYGDSLCGLFEYLRLISDNSLPYISSNQEFGDSEKHLKTRAEYTPGSNEVIIFPTYSEINLKLRSDEYFSKLYTNSGAYMLHEYSGVYEDTIRNEGAGTDPIYMINENETVYTQENDLYLFNNTYSRSQDSLIYYEKPIVSSVIEEFKTRIIGSQQKTLGESSDSFLKQSGSYIDVDGQYGEIVKMLVFNERLYFFQNNAIGIAAVSERSTTNDSSGSSILIGEIDLLSRYDYVTIENGINNTNHVARSSSSLYIIDATRKQILKMDNGIEKISITKHVDSLIRSIDLSDARIVYNRKYSEVLFFYSETSESTEHKALVYNEQMQQFSAIYSFNGKARNSVTINKEDLNTELVLSDNNLVFGLDEGDYNKIYDTYIPSEITFLIAGNKEDIVLYNSIEAIIRQVDSNDNSVDFIDTIRIYNRECDTGDMDFAASTGYKFGKYRTNKLRNYEGNKERMLSDHIYVNITTKSNDGNNYRVFFRDLIVSFSEYMYNG